MLEKMFNGRLSVSVTVFMLSSVIVRFFGLGCIGLAFYMKYGDRLIDDDVLPALNSLEIYGMELGTFIQGVVFSTVVFFGFEFVNGIFGIYAGLNKRKNFLIAYICICLCFIVVCIVEIVLWSLMYYWINNALEENIDTFHKRYSGSYLKNGYHEKWKALYNCLECCGTNGTGNTCSGVNGNGVNFPGCFDLYSEKMNLYIQVYLGIIIVCFLCQIIGIGAADYTVIKQQMKNEGVKKLTPTRIISVIVKSINMVSSIALIITSLWFIRSDLITNQEFIYYFRRMDIYGYSYHNVFTGFACCTLAIGTFGIVIGVIGLVGSTKQSTALHTVTFVSSIFQCCVIKTQSQAFFCYSNMHESIVNYGIGWTSHGSYIGSGLYGTNEGEKYCSEAISGRLVGISGYYFAFLILGIICDITTIVTLNTLLTLTFVIMGSVMRNDICALIIHDRIHQYTEITDELSQSDEKKQPGLLRTVYAFLFVERQLFKNNRKLEIPVAVYVVASIVMTLLETTFIVLVCFYGFSWLLDRRWITTGLYILDEETVNIGVLFDFLKISLLALIPIISINRICGVVSVLTRRKIFLYVVSGVHAFTLLISIIFLILSSIVLRAVSRCTLDSESCPSRRYVIVGVAVAMLILEILIQVISFLVHDRCYKYFLPDEVTESLVGPDQQKGMFLMMYDKFFRRRKKFSSGKIEVLIAVHFVLAVFFLVIELIFIALVSVYGLSSVLDRQWITSGLSSMYKISMNLEVVFKFLSIGCLVLIPLISINRIIGIIAVSCTWIKVVYVNSVIMAFTLSINIVFICLGAILLHEESECQYIDALNSSTKTCPKMKATVGIGLAIFCSEFVMQVLSIAVNDRSYKYIENIKPNEQDDSATTDTGQGLFLMIYDKTFRRRKPFLNAVKIEVMSAVYSVISVIVLMIEITFIVLNAVYGLSHVIDRKWITEGLSKQYITSSIDLESFYKFLSIGSIVIVPLISINRFVGLIAISTKKTKILYINFILTIVASVVTFIFVILTSILLAVITHAVLSAKVKDQLKARIMDSSNPLPESRKVFHRPSHVPDLNTKIHHDDTESIS
ncbi:unnamed protein product [Mytilus edulis]|uniref:Uncharacterized protein n=1 Tax=Mytilus edulis TaxID=6550 RepID=A0A8S3RLL2_MYTED|nr:unnamed protein product [Mytilus edulis]